MRQKPLALCALCLCILMPTSLLAAGKIFYGSRAGMQVTVVGVSGIGTSNAVIRVKHLPEDAKEYCTGYENDTSAACVERALRDTRINDVLTGNCLTGVFTTLYGERLRFAGEQRHAAQGDPSYVILRGREKLDGSSASGYGYDLDQFAALCPNRAQADR